MSAPLLNLNSTEDLEILTKSGLSLTEYAALCTKYCVKQPTVLDYEAVSPERLLHELPIADNIVMVRGCFKQGTDEPRENNTKLFALIQSICASKPLMQYMGAQTNDVAVVLVSNKDSKSPHPEILQKLENGKLKLLHGGLVRAGVPRPAATLVFHAKQFFYCTNGGLCGNMQMLPTPVAISELGCTKVPECLLGVTLTSKEQLLHLMKALAAYAHPELRVEGVSDEVARKSFDALSLNVDCTMAKKLGREVKVSKIYFEKCGHVSERLATTMQLLHMGQDRELVAFMHFMDVNGIRVVESAMHGGKGSFQGNNSDLVWGSTYGGVQMCLNPFGLSGGGTTQPIGVFSRGVRRAIDVCRQGGNPKNGTMAFLGLKNPPVDTKEYLATVGLIIEHVCACIQYAAYEATADSMMNLDD
jgi:hypothetical protein